VRYRRFGKTELQLPVISCGGMRFQQSWNGDDAVSEESQANLEACVRRAFDLGINHFETARGYGTSELQLGRILPQLPRDEIIVQTKIPPAGDAKQFGETFEKSMGLLHLDFVDLLAVHGINDEDSLKNALACLDQARAWKREGRIRHLGFSSHGHRDIIIEAIDSGAFDYVNLHWYYIFQDNWPAILRARERDMGVFIISPNDKGGLLYQPSEKLLALTAPYHPMVFNDLFCLSHPEVHTLSCGVAKPGDFDLHVQAADLLDRADEIVPAIEQCLAAEFERVHGAAWMQTWDQGLPKWDETPGGINIPLILRLRNLALAFDMIEFGKMRYNLLGNGGHWFPGYKADKVDEFDLGPCLRNSPHADRIPGFLKEADALLAGEERKRLQQDD